MKYIIELFNPYTEPNINEFDTEEEAREFLKLKISEDSERGWDYKRLKD